MDIKQTIFDFSNASGTSGMESNAALLGEKLLSQYGKVKRTPLGSLICTVKEPKEGQSHVMLEAHMDEIGMVVTNIDSKGFLKISGVGGIDRNAVMASPVTVHTKDGDLRAVVCAIPPHLQDGDEDKLPKIEAIAIDTGFKKEDIEKKVRLGDRITFDCIPAELLNNTIMAKAEDDRACCTVLLRACEMLKDEQYNCGLSVVFSVMEEVGGQGAKTATAIVNPTNAIACDVSFAFTPDAKRHQCSDLGKGGMISYAPILNNEMTEKLIALAEENKVPYQVDVMGGGTGTDADNIATFNGGVRTALISLPQKYMHTTIETISLEDVESIAKVMALYIKSL